MKLFQILIIIFLSLAGITAISSMEKPNINTLENQKQLRIAIKNNKTEEVRQLLKAGLNPNFVFQIAPSYWVIPLIEAVSGNNPEIVQLLLDHGADPNATDLGSHQFQDSALMKALSVEYPTIDDTSDNNPAVRQSKIITMLLANPKLKINQKNKLGDSALTFVTRKSKFFDTILNAKDVDVNIQEGSGKNSLMLLIQHKSINESLPFITKLLLHEDSNGNKDIKINLGDLNGETALDYARKKTRSKTITELLIQHGATSGAPERRKISQGGTQTFTQAGSQTAQPPAPQAFFPQPPPAQPIDWQAYLESKNQQLEKAIINNNPIDVNAAFNSGADPNALNEHGVPIFFDALNNMPIIRLFLAHPKFNPNLMDIWAGIPALSRAIGLNNNEVAFAFIHHPKIDLNLADSAKLTPLDYAYEANNKPVYQLLKSKGARAHTHKGPHPSVIETFSDDVYAALGLSVNTKNGYTIIGVEETSSDEAIKKRFRELTLQWHPDKNKDNPIAGQVYSLIKNAYEAILRVREL